MAKGDEAFSIRRGEAKLIRDLDLHPKKGGLFGDHLLISKAAAVKAAAVKAAAVNAIPILLSEREQTIVDGLKC